MPELFADRYDIQHELGRGAFGVVSLAHDVRLRGRPVQPVFRRTDSFNLKPAR